MDRLELFTDGACIGNPGPGGWGVVILSTGGQRELSGGFRNTTNNRMEIFAALAALRTLERPTQGVLYSDSRYVIDAIEKGWAEKWRKSNWMRTKTDRAMNADLWEQMLGALDSHDIRFKWVRGHAGHPQNERCDLLATTAARKGGWPADPGYGTAARSANPGLFPG